MKKTIPTILALVIALSAMAARAETYRYTGPNFDAVTGSYDTGMSITGYITTSGPLEPDFV